METNQNANSPEMSRYEEQDSAQAQVSSLQLPPISNMATANNANTQVLPPIHSALSMSRADFAPPRDNWFPPYPYPGSRQDSTPEQVGFGPAGCTPYGSNLFPNETRPGNFKCHHPGCMAGPFTTEHQLRYHPAYLWVRFLLTQSSGLTSMCTRRTDCISVR